MNQIEKIGLACDHAGFQLKCHVKRYLEAHQIPCHDFGTHSEQSCDYPDYAHPLAQAVEQGQCTLGIAICGSGQGISMTLNKHQGIRAALCWNPQIAALARQHNNANILAMPGRFVTPSEAEAIIHTFLYTPYEGGRHQARIDKIPLHGKAE